MKFSKLLLATLALYGLVFSNSAIADDLDAFKQLAKSNAMILMDTSGSMSWPVYNPAIDYAAVMNWMKTSGLAKDDDASKTLSWLKDDYSGINPDGIYLVKSPRGFREITYLDSEGNEHTKAVIGDVMQRQGTLTSTANYRDDWIEKAIIPCINEDGSLWLQNDESTLDVITVNETEYIAFPKGNLQNLISSTTIINTTNVQGALKNHQSIPLHKIVVDNETNLVSDYGFVGFIRSSGYYFSGSFGTSSTTDTAISQNYDSLTYSDSYIFATGNWINFIKFVEDFYVEDAYASCKKDDGPYRYQEHLAWRYFCYTGGEELIWSESPPFIIQSHDIDYKNISPYHYPDTNPTNYDSTRGMISAPVQSAKQLKIRFEYINIDYTNPYWEVLWWFWGKWIYPDFVELIDNDTGKSLVAISGENITSSSPSAKVSYDGGITWTVDNNFLDSEGYTKTFNARNIRVRFVNNEFSKEGQQWGFKISGYKYVSIDSSQLGDHTCCGGTDGTGYKVKSRIDVAKTAMKNAVRLTEDTISWGLSRFNYLDGGTTLAPLASSSDLIINKLDTLIADGATPLGEALQDTYNSNFSFLENNPESAECSANFIISVTDGFPSDDELWSRINVDTSPNFGKCTQGYDQCTTIYGDADDWRGTDNNENFTDDVAHWMYNEAKYKHTTHAIAFGLDNPMLGDVADSSNGIYITAYNEEQLLNAFYSLGLSMANAISFAAPAISVDEENRAQAGDELYMAFFRPVRADYWQGNLKRFKISWNSTKETIVDQFGNEVTEADGSFRASSSSFWSTDVDGGQINKGGAGEVLQNKVITNFSTNPYNRMLYTHKGGLLTAFTKLNIDPADLGVSTDEEAAKIINFIYGYTYDADTSGNPIAVRNWVLGDIIHSEPLVIDYVDSSPQRVLTNRYITIGSNHGVLHVFDTTTGEEKFGFIPPNLLKSLTNFANISERHYYGVDGQISKFQTSRNPELMVLGLRRGGRAYYALDISNPATTMWDLAWSISYETPGFSELGQTWSKVYFTTMPQTDGTLIDIGVFTGGYDPAEDTNSTSFLPQGNSQGRGIFVVNATDGSLVFKCTFGTTNSTSDLTAFTRTDMKYSFPGDPRVIRLPDGHKDGDLVIYAVDVAGQLWKMLYDKNASPQWQVYRLFNSNGPTNTEGGADVASGLSAKLENTGVDSASLLNPNDIGRKSFSQPDVSYAGDCSTDNPVIYFGTGDRENPLDTTVSHRFYAIYDMSTNNTNSTYYNLILNEADLLNVSDVSSNSSNPTQQLGNEYDSKAQGWYIQFDQQNDAFNHSGEKLTSSPRLFNKTIFFSTYKPTFDDICAPNGDSFLYAIKYCSGMPAYAWVDTDGKPTRYQLHRNSPLASSWRIMAKEGVAAGKISVGSKLINIPIEIPSGLNLIWWDYD